MFLHSPKFEKHLSRVCAPQSHHAEDQIPARDAESDLREGGQEIETNPVMEFKNF